MTERKYGKLEDIPVPLESPHPLLSNRYRDTSKLDPGIDKLVRVLNAMGFQTIGSCEGHLDGDHHPFPWVTIEGLAHSRESYVRRSLKQIIGEYNHSGHIKWHIHTGLETSSMASSEEELKHLQQGADDLADYLFNKYLKTS